MNEVSASLRANFQKQLKTKKAALSGRNKSKYPQLQSSDFYF